jgi:hypothetical protein
MIMSSLTEELRSRLEVSEQIDVLFGEEEIPSADVVSQIESGIFRTEYKSGSILGQELHLRIQQSCDRGIVWADVLDNARMQLEYDAIRTRASDFVGRILREQRESLS